MILGHYRSGILPSALTRKISMSQGLSVPKVKTVIKSLISRFLRFVIKYSITQTWLFTTRERKKKVTTEAAMRFPADLRNKVTQES